jgi:hypothetical protein
MTLQEHSSVVPGPSGPISWTVWWELTTDPARAQRRRFRVHRAFRDHVEALLNEPTLAWLLVGTSRETSDPGTDSP